MKKLSFKKLNRKKVIKWLIIAVVILLFVFYVYKKIHPTQVTKEVMTSKAIIGNVETEISGNGTLSPADQYDVKSLVKGEILKASFKEGDTVKKGELLYQISTSDIANSIKAAELGVQKAKLAYNNSLDKKAGLHITAMESGYIKKLYVKAGEKIQVGKTIADIYNGDEMYIDLLFPSDEVKESWVSKSASVSMDATGETMKGRVIRVSSMEEVMNGGVLAKKVTICVINKGGIKVGDTAEASIGTISSNDTGTFYAKTDTVLVAEAEGKIDNLAVKEGQWVQKGDKVLSLASKDYDSQVETADLGITEAELSLKTQKNQMKLYTIKAPISGQVITKTKKQGDTIDPATDTQAGPMATIYDMSYLSFQLNIDELQIHNVKIGQKVNITTEAFPKDKFTGVIDRISLKGDTKEGVTSYPVIVKVIKFGNLLPSMNVTGKIMIEEANHVLTIPSCALQRGNMVYVKSKENVKSKAVTKSKGTAQSKTSEIPEGFKAVKVKIGINDGANVEIKKGLKKGDIVYVPFDDSTAASADKTITVE